MWSPIIRSILLQISFLLLAERIDGGIINKYDSVVDLQPEAAEPRPIYAYLETKPEPLPLTSDSSDEGSQKIEKYLRRPIAFSYNQPEDKKDDNVKSETIIYPEKQQFEDKGEANQEKGEKLEEEEHPSEDIQESHEEDEAHSADLQEDKAEHTKKSDGGGDGKKKLAKPHKEKHAKGGGKSHHSDHHSSHGEKGDKGYKGHHHHEKGEKGHHNKEGHKKSYSNKQGKKSEHHHDDGYSAEHHHGEKGEKSHKVIFILIIISSLSLYCFEIFSTVNLENTKKVTAPKVNTIFTRRMNMKRNKSSSMKTMKMGKKKNTEDLA